MFGLQASFKGLLWEPDAEDGLGKFGLSDDDFGEGILEKSPVVPVGQARSMSLRSGSAGFRTAITAGQPLPSYLFLGLVGLFYACLMALFFWGFRRRKASGEFQKRPASRGWTM